jgi:carbonic anhydrase
MATTWSALPDKTDRVLSRRRLLRASAAGAGLVAGLGGGSMTPHPALAQAALGSDDATANLTPQGALNKLKRGNARYLTRTLKSFAEDRAELRSNTQEKQVPFAAVLSCADSRVPVELVFDQSIGELFVVRVAGNITTPEIIASLEFSVAVIKTVRAILVLGHGSCGAVRHTILRTPAPGQITAVYPHIQPAVDLVGRSIKLQEEVTRANAKIQASLLSESSPVLAGSIQRGELAITSGYYDIVSGEVTFDT